MIAIIDYGMGNLRSVAKAFERVGVKVFLTGDPSRLEQAGGIVLPGVGAFADAMANLCSTGMDQAITGRSWRESCCWVSAWGSSYSLNSVKNGA